MRPPERARGSGGRSSVRVPGPRGSAGPRAPSFLYLGWRWRGLKSTYPAPEGITDPGAAPEGVELGAGGPCRRSTPPPPETTSAPAAANGPAAGQLKAPTRGKGSTMPRLSQPLPPSSRTWETSYSLLEHEAGGGGAPPGDEQREPGHPCPHPRSPAPGLAPEPRSPGM